MRTFVYIIIFILSSLFSFGQNEEYKTIEEIKKLDSEFWKAYNSCNIETMPNYISKNIEFYHDKGGVILGLENLINSIKNNLCHNVNYKIRREVVINSENHSILYNGKIIYGLIHTGEHFFYLTLDNKKEFQDGKAKFTHLWLFKNNEWKLERIYSYDHKAIIK